MQMSVIITDSSQHAKHCGTRLQRALPDNDPTHRHVLQCPLVSQESPPCAINSAVDPRHVVPALKMRHREFSPLSTPSFVDPLYQIGEEGFAIFLSLRPLPGGRRLAAARTGVSDCAGFAPNEPQPRLALTALSLTPCHPPSVSVLSLSPFPSCFFPLPLRVKEETRPKTARKGKTMKLEEVNKRTKRGRRISSLQSLESGQSEVLTAYLGAMAKFRNYSFGNIMLIARQKPDATHVAGYRTWTSCLAASVRHVEKKAFSFSGSDGRTTKYGPRMSRPTSRPRDR